MIILTSIAALSVAVLIFVRVFNSPNSAVAVSIYGYIALEFLNLKTFSVALAGVDFTVFDVIYGSILFASFLRLFFTKRYSWMILVLVLLPLLISMSRGIYIFGLNTIDADARTFVYMTGLMIYFFTFKDKLDGNYISQVLKNTGVALCLIVIFRLSATFLGLSIAESWRDISNSAGGLAIRVIPAAPTFLLGLSFLLAFVDMSSNKSLSNKICLVVPPILIVLLQHRTIWAGVVAGLMLAVTLQKSLSSIVKNIIVITCVVGVLYALSIQGNSEVISSVQGSSENVETFQWRLDGWWQLLTTSPSSPQHIIDHIFGTPFGSGYVRYFDGQEIDVNPHNFYIHTYLRLGAFGLFFLLCSIINMLWSTKGSKDNKSMFIAVYLVYQSLYFWTYPITYEQAVVFTFYFAYIVAEQRRKSAENSNTSNYLQSIRQNI